MVGESDKRTINKSSVNRFYLNYIKTGRFPSIQGQIIEYINKNIDNNYKPTGYINDRIVNKHKNFII